MSRDYVFTTRSLNALLEQAPDNDWFTALQVPEDGRWGVLAIDVGSAVFVIDRHDLPEASRIVVVAQGERLLQPLPLNALRTAFQRIHRVALEAERPPVILPPAWSEFKENNLLAFFACSRDDGAFRWIAQVSVHGSTDTCFWAITAPGDQVRLRDYDPPYSRYHAAVANWHMAFEAAKARFQQVREPSVAPLQPAVDLEATTFGAVTRYRTYSDWFEHLTPQQREFVESPPTHSVKLRGPAGTGKTLVLELKALKELYDARSTGRSPQILFVTHSWALAQQVENGLRQLDESGDISDIDVFPLLAVADLVLPPERAAIGFLLLGEDSLEGKRLQLERIDELVERVRQGDWLTYRSKASEELRSRMSAKRGSAQRNGLVWDLMIEFSCVLSAHGILPGINAEREYVSLQRAPWMMPLPTHADKRFALRVYTEYVGRLKEDGFLASDQLINDFLNYLETFSWNLRRERDGYDLIIVDELHLFSDQERLALHYLTRTAGKRPIMYMALDARQAPFEVYDLAIDVPARGVSRQPEEYLGEVRSLDLATIHRFTPEILRLVQHIHGMYPALDLGPDWELDLKSLNSAVAPGPLPELIRHRNERDEIASVISRAAYFTERATQDERVAIVVVDTLRLQEFSRDADAREVDIPLRVIAGRDDVETLRYSRRGVVLTAAEYVGGLQFANVIIAGLPDTRGIANRGYELRRFLSLIYLAVSRATTRIEIHVNDSGGGVPKILESALTAGILREPQAKA